MQVVICIVNTLQFYYRPQTNWRRLCFHGCLSVHSGGGVCQGDPTPVRYCAAGTHPARMHSWYRLQTKFAKVMFLRVSVILFTGGYPSMQCRWYPSMHCRSPGGGIPACLAGLQAHTQWGSWGVWPGGSPGPHPGGSLGVRPGESPGPHPGGKLRGLAWGGSPGPHMRGLQAHTQGKVEGSGLGGSPDPHPGESWGVWPGGLQAHTQGGSWGVWPGGSPGPHLRVSRPTPRGGSWGVWPGGSPGPHPGGYPSMHWGRTPQQTATAAGGTHPTGMHSC